MENQKIIYYPILNDSEKTEIIKESIRKGLLTNLQITDNIDEANMLLIGGGDGFMLDTIKKYWKYQKPFFGINHGTLGFLLNNISPENIPTDFNKLQIIQEQMFQTTITQQDGTKIDMLGINDIVLGGNVLDFIEFTINTNDNETITTKGTGIVISTAIGSTAYWLNLGGPLIPLKTNILGIIGIAAAPFKYKITEHTPISIQIKSRSKVLAGVDGYGGQIQDIKSIDIYPSQNSFQLGFLLHENLELKRIMLAGKKL